MWGKITNGFQNKNVACIHSDIPKQNPVQPSAFKKNNLN